MQRLATAGQRQAAWLVLKPLLNQSGPSKRAELDRLSWALALSADQAPAERRGLLAKARAYALSHLAVGQAWAEYAIAQQQAGQSEELRDHWWQALRNSPDTSPWLPIAIEQFLDLSLAGTTPWRPPTEVSAQGQGQARHLAAVLERVELEQAQRFEWLLAQFLVQVKLSDLAAERLRRLQATVSAERSARIAEVLAELEGQVGAAP